MPHGCLLCPKCGTPCPICRSCRCKADRYEEVTPFLPPPRTSLPTPLVLPDPNDSLTDPALRTLLEKARPYCPEALQEEIDQVLGSFPDPDPV